MKTQTCSTRSPLAGAVIVTTAANGTGSVMTLELLLPREGIVDVTVALLGSDRMDMSPASGYGTFQQRGTVGMQPIANCPCNPVLSRAQKLLGDQELNYGVMNITLPQEIRKKACRHVSVDISSGMNPRSGEHIHLEFNKQKLRRNHPGARELFLLLTRSQLNRRVDEAATLLDLGDRDDEYAMEALQIVFYRFLSGDPAMLTDK